MIEIKVYHDGENYVGIPQHPKRARSRLIKKEEYIEIEPETKEITPDNSSNGQVVNDDKTTENKPVKMTKKELFNKLYEDNISLKFKDKQDSITNGMKKYFGSYEDAKNYVEHQLENKRKSIINKRKRFYRKVAMNEFNYFVTFTYADNLHTEQSFQKKLKNCLGHLHNRKGWKYAGVFEKSKNDRLHFHGLLYVPEGQMVGELFEKKDYNTRTHKMQTTTQNTFFNNKFGRSDFESITRQDLQLGNTVKYIVKYITKSNTKVLYSRHLPMYVKGLVHEDDIICLFKDDDLNRVVLFDDFNLWDYEGTCCGAVNEENRERFGVNT